MRGGGMKSIGYWPLPNERKRNIFNPTQIKRSLTYKIIKLYFSDAQMLARYGEIRQGVCMERIVFEKYEAVKVQNYNMYEVSGTKVLDNAPFKTRFFTSSKDMAAIVKNASPGDIIAITMKQKGSYFNPIKMVNETKEGTAPAQPGAPQSVTGGNKPMVIEDPKNKDAELACTFYIGARANGMQPNEISEAFQEALTMSDMIKDWREGKGAFAFNPNADIPSTDTIEEIDED